MDLDPTRIGPPGNEAYVKFLHSVATDWYTVALRHFCGLEPARNPTAIRRVRLDIGDLGLTIREFEFMERVQVSPIAKGMPVASKTLA